MPKDNYELGTHKRNQARVLGPTGPGSKIGGEKAKDFKKGISQLFFYAKNYKKSIITAIFIEFFASILIVIGPNKLKELVNEISKGLTVNIGQNQNSINFDTIFNIGLFLILIYALSYIFSVFQSILLSKATQNIAKNLRSDIINKINKLPMSFFAKTSKGDVLSRITNDVDTIGQSLAQSIGMIISAATLMIGSLVMMFFTNIILSITSLLSTLLGMLLMTFLMRNSHKYFRRQQAKLGELNGHIEEMFAGLSVIRAYNGEEEAKNIFHTINKDLKENVFKSNKISGIMMPLMMFIGNFGYVCVCIVGAVLAIEGHISFGVIIAFIVYVRLFTQPLGQVAQSMQSLQSSAAASERVFEFLGAQEIASEENYEAKLPTIKGKVEFKNVCFSYEESDRIINNFTLEIEAGQKIAIIGATGAGKTTLINLLMRFYEIDSGEILIDNISIKDISKEELHEKFSMVLQETWLFEGTLKENIIYSTPNVSEQQLEKAILTTGLQHFVKSLEYGYDTMLNDKLELSQGQMQQITIARAMIADKPMLILDEATSSIDTRTELQIQSAMDTLMRGRTSFVIAHRLSTIKNADLIIAMKDGTVLEQGKHEELLAKKAYYYELYHSQFES